MNKKKGRLKYNFKQINGNHNTAPIAKENIKLEMQMGNELQ